jgi:hypothetical protein
MNADRTLSVPGVRFTAGTRLIDATVFPLDGIRQAPCSPVDGRPMRRAGVGELTTLIEEGAPSTA